MSTEEFRFSVDSNLLLELGERLVSNKIIALGELVKNAYDADATLVTIRLVEMRNPGGSIEIQDDGQGMDYEGVVSGWMRIATSDKSSNPDSSRFKRPRAGSKGVGRFACRALAEVAILETVGTDSEGKKESIRVAIDWAAFTPGKVVDSVPVSCSRTPASGSTPTGTTLRLQRARHSWTDDDVMALRRSLYTFSTAIQSTKAPESLAHGSKSDPGLEVVLEAHEYADQSGPVTEEPPPPSWGRLTGVLNGEGVPEFSLHINDPERVVRFYPRTRLPAVGPARFTADLFLLKAGMVKGLGIEVRQARRWGREHGGVKVYIDGFRVYPYGEPGDDWLNLDSDRGRRLTVFRHLHDVDEDLRRPALLLPGNNQLYGEVHLTRAENPTLQPTITRDRLVANESFEQLREFVRLGIEWLTVQYVRFDLEVDRRQRARRERVDPIARLEQIVQKVGGEGSKISASVASELAVDVAALRQSLEETREEQVKEIAMLRVLATTGTMVAILDHEITRIQEQLRSLAEQLEAVPIAALPAPTASEVKRVAASLKDWATVVEQYGLQLTSLLGAEARDRRRPLPLQSLVRDLALPFRQHLKNFGIEFVNEVGLGITLPPMYLCEGYSIFVNLMTNSIKAVKSSNVRKIGVQAAVSGSRLLISFLDSGPGIDASRREEVFSPFVSDSVPDPLLGTGTGLGLTIARGLVEANGGRIEFTDPPSGWSCCASIVFPIQA
jgi:signal transduction histidine kinase